MSGLKLSEGERHGERRRDTERNTQRDTQTQREIQTQRQRERQSIVYTCFLIIKESSFNPYFVAFVDFV